MANKIFNTRVKNKRDTEANWKSKNPVLLDGEIIIVTTTSGDTRFKVGDGKKTYNQLPFQDQKTRDLIPSVDSSLSSTSTNPVQNKIIKSELDKKAERDVVNTTTNGLMSVDDKKKLDGIDAGANKTIVDTKLSSTSTNPVQNKAINSALSRKAGISVATTGLNGLMSAEDKTKLNGIATGAEVNQNAFSNIAVGSTTIAADTKTDTLAIEAGSNIIITPDATNDKITIAAKSYTARTGVPTEDAAPAFGGTFKVSQPVSNSTGHITAINTRTITIPNSTATTSTAGLMSASDKTKLDDMEDYVIMQHIVSGIGSNTSNWGYRKWHSGYAECYLKMPIENVACNTAIGNWYRTEAINLPDFPFGFKYYPIVNMYFETLSYTGGIVWTLGGPEDNPRKYPPGAYIIRMVSSDSITGYLNVQVVGRWI